MDAVDPQLLKAMRSAWGRVRQRRRRQRLDRDALRMVSSELIDEKSRNRRLMMEKRRARLQEVIKRLHSKKNRQMIRIPKKQTKESHQMSEPEGEAMETDFNPESTSRPTVFLTKTHQMKLDNYFVKK